MDADLLRDMTTLLGPDPYAQTRAFDRLSEARTYVASYAALLTRLGDPIAPDRLEPLAAAFLNVDPSRANPARITSAQWSEFLKRAGQLLTPSQLEILETATPPGIRSPQQQRLDELLTSITGQQRGS